MYLDTLPNDFFDPTILKPFICPWQARDVYPIILAIKQLQVTISDTIEDHSEDYLLGPAVSR